MSNTYTLYHLHDMRSLLDSTTRFDEYVDFAVENGMSAIGLSNHGTIYDWNASALLAHDRGLKFLFGCEVYLTENPYEKVRDNYHTIMYARNKDGADELRELLSKSWDADHKYYKNRISFEEFCSTSNNIITTSACLASPLNALDENNRWFSKLCRRYDFFEVQAHDDTDQKFFNWKLMELAKQYNKPLIAGTDTHSSTQYAAECRRLMMARKHIAYAAEDSFDLTLKTREQLEEMFEVQDVLPCELAIEAIDNTNLLAEMCEDVVLDDTPKYVILHGSKEADRKEWIRTVGDGFKAKVQSGAILESEVPSYKERLTEEMSVFDALGNHGYMLFMSELLDWCHKHGIPTGPSRGSVGGCCSAYCAGITDLNPVRYNTLFSRFLTPERKDDPDIDVDVAYDQRDLVYKHIIDQFGVPYTAFVLSFGTADKKAAIDDIVGGLRELWKMQNLHERQIKEGRAKVQELYAKAGTERSYLLELVEEQIEKVKAKIKEYREYDAEHENDNPWSLKLADQIKADYEKDEESARKKYPEVFKYFDGIRGVYVNTSIHPAGIIVAPCNLDKEYGTIINSDGQHVLGLTMDAAHEARLIKYDLLALRNVQILRDTYNYVGLDHYLTSKDVDFTDNIIWDDICKSGTGVFQFSSDFAFSALTQMKPRSIEDLSLLTAALRPGAASYRDDLVKRNIHKNPVPELDNLLKDSGGYVLYQESITQFLTDICGFESNRAEAVRKAVCKKKVEAIEEAIPSIIDGYCANMTQFTRDEAERQCQEFIQVMRDAGSYAFNKSHAVGYSLLTAELVNARARWPLEFCTAFLNDAANQDDISDGTELARIYKIDVLPPEFGISQSGYSFDKERNVIVKGVSSVKYMNRKVAKELYDLYHRTDGITQMPFIEVCKLITKNMKIDERQMKILIKIGYFRMYGEENHLLTVFQAFIETFKSGEISSLNKDRLSVVFEDIDLKLYASDLRKDGSEGKTWKVSDVDGLMDAVCASLINSDKIKNATIKEKIEWHTDYLGYVGISTGKQEDIRRVYVSDVSPLLSKYGDTSKPWTYRLEVLSIGTGKSSVIFCKTKVYGNAPIKKGDVIYIPSGGLIKGQTKDGRTTWDLKKYQKEYLT